jgi:hypothetical protein
MAVQNRELVTKHNILCIENFLHNLHKFRERKINIKWGSGNNKDINTNILLHYNKHTVDSLEENEQWKKFYNGDISLEMYKKFPMKYFYQMKKIILHSNGKEVYISGFYNNFFIVGRLNESTELFSISSCYYVVNGEKKGRYTTMLLDIDVW